MTHPLIPQILELATPIAADIGLEIVDLVFQTNRRPPTLRVDIRNTHRETGLDDCEKMSRELENRLEAIALIPGAYVLEVSSPGISRKLTSDRDFLSFKGFAVVVTATEPWEGQSQWQGRLQGRDENHLYLSLKGRVIAIPRPLIATVQLES